MGEWASMVSDRVLVEQVVDDQSQIDQALTEPNYTKAASAVKRVHMQ